MTSTGSHWNRTRLLIVLVLILFLRQIVFLKNAIPSTTTSDWSENVAPSAPIFANSKSSLCQQIAHIYKEGEQLSAGTLWMQNLENILAASESDKSRQATFNLLMDLKPKFLDQALLTPPKAEDIQRIWDILERRRQDPENAPPLRILVMGGSITQGSGCMRKGVSEKECRWTFRLSKLINELLGYEAVQIYNIAAGGTSTVQALSVLKYWLYPESVQKITPDIILHSFAANDSLWGNMKPTNTELERINRVLPQVVKAMNDFYEQVMESYPCPISKTPIVMFLDDYVGGHSQGAALGDTLYRMVLAETSAWQGNMAVSLSKIVRPFIWTNPVQESTFSPPWRYDKPGRFRPNPHFGWQGHQAIAWTWTYSALQAAVDYCRHEEWDSMQPKIPNDLVRQSTTTQQTLDLMSQPPPPLDMDTRLEDMAKKWKQKTLERQTYCANSTDATSSPPCAMAWVASPASSTPNEKKLKAYLKRFIETKNGWGAESDMKHGWKKKLGVVASKPDALLVFQFKDIQKPIRTLTIHSLKSYGEKWEGSLARFVVESNNGSRTTTLLNTTISGIHDSHSSITYTNVFRLDEQSEIPTGSQVRVEVRLIGGSTFKLTGMMLCST